MRTWTLVVVALGAASGVAQLVTSGPGRVVLIFVFTAAVLFLAGRLSYPLMTRSLVAQLAEKTAEVDRYRAALRRVANPPQLSLLEEELQIVVTIGAGRSEDHILQRHKTTAQPSLLYRMIRPITPFGSRPTSYLDLELQARSMSEDVHLSILPLSENTAGVWLLILLQPQLTGEMEWEIEYRAPGLWDPLRDPHQGVDSLGWIPRLGRDLTYADRLTRFEVQFLFPRNAGGVTVRETGRGRGSQTTDVLPTGQKRVVWVDNAPSVERYEWELSAAFAG
jgi:hypothetical protein